MKHPFFDNFKINHKKDGFGEGQNFATDIIKGRMEALELHKKLIKVQTKQELKTLTQNLKSLLENERFEPEIIKNIVKKMNEETLEALEKI